MLKQSCHAFRLACLGLVLLCAAAQGWAQGVATGRSRIFDPAGLLNSVVTTIIFGVLGTLLTILGFKVFDWLTPFNLEKEVCEKQNMAVAVVCAAMMLGISLIVAMTILS